MLPQPDEFPDWATQDQVDSVSHINNVVSPPLEAQQSGWLRQQFPPRQWFNWLGRFTGQWIRYLNQQVGTAGTDITALQTQVNSMQILQTVVFQGTYGVASPSICDVNTKSIVSVKIVDDSGGSATDFYMANFIPRNATPNRNIDADIINSKNLTIPAGVDFTTGSITVATIGLGSTYQCVAIQYTLGV